MADSPEQHVCQQCEGWCMVWRRKLNGADRELCSDGPYVLRKPPREGVRAKHLALWRRELEARLAAVGSLDALPTARAPRAKDAKGSRAKRAKKPRADGGCCG